MTSPRRARGIRIDGRKLREHRERCGLTQVQLAEIGHVTSRWVMAVENDTRVGGRPPAVGPLVLEAWANRLGVETTDLEVDRAPEAVA